MLLKKNNFKLPMLKSLEFIIWNDAQKNIAYGLVLLKNNQNPIVKSKMKPEKCTIQ